MKYEVVEHKKFPGEWAVEAINYVGDGEVYDALFSGPKAEERAREYAAYKNLQETPHDTQ